MIYFMIKKAFTIVLIIFGIIMALVIESEVIPDWKRKKDRVFYAVWIGLFYTILIIIMIWVWSPPVWD